MGPKKKMTEVMTKMSKYIRFHNQVSSAGFVIKVTGWRTVSIFLKEVSLEEWKELAKINKLSENFLLKVHLLESCISKFNDSKDGCSQKITHSYANIKPSKTSKLPTPRQIVNFTFDTNLQIIHVILSNGSKSICVVRHRLRLSRHLWYQIYHKKST